MPHLVLRRGWRTLLLALGCCWLGLAEGQAWNWRIPRETFQELSAFERNQYQKAEKLFEDKQYKLAALEFDKFVKEYPDSTALAAALFMQGLSQQSDLKRSQAIKVYQQVIDYFPDDAYYAGAAQYYIGASYLDNGDTKLGLKEMQKMVAHETYKKHPLAAAALDKLADNAKANEDWPAYFKYLTQIYRDFFNSNRGQADRARDELARCYVKNGSFAKIVEVTTDINWKDPRADAGFWFWLWDRAFHETFANYYKPIEGTQKHKDEEAFLAFWRGGAEVMLANNKWEYHRRILEFLLRYMPEHKEEWQKALDNLKAMELNDDMIRHITWCLVNYGQVDDSDAFVTRAQAPQALYPWLFGELVGRGKLERAEHVLAKIEDPGEHAWREFELYRARDKMQDCLRVLKQLAENDEKRAQQANWEMGMIYMHRLGKMEEAIQALNAANNPPTNTFEIAECFRRAGQMERSAATYAEIENFFPEHAPEAAWRRARMYEAFGATEKAIAEYRRVLKVYGDKPQASRAHQDLERLGVKTGGGEIK